jgi:hypothetical protein
MVDKLAYKKNRKKRRIKIATLISTCSVIALIIVAFLSSYVGNFTISVINYNSKIALSTNADMSDETTFLKGDAFNSAVETTVSFVDEFDQAFVGESQIDTNSGGSKNQIYTDPKQNTSATWLYIYTFFVTNVGDGPCYYYYGLNIDAEKAETSDTGERRISDSLRIRVYQNLNGSSTSHFYTDYTRKNADDALETYGANTSGYAGVKAYLEQCAVDAAKTSDESGRLVYFNDSANIIISDDSATKLAPNDIVRYTLAIWVEGNDPDTTGDYTKSTLRLSAYVGSRNASDEA